MRLSVLEREPTGPLIRTSLPANPAIAAGEKNAPQRDKTEEATATNAQRVRKDACLRPHAVGVESVGGVEEGRDGHRGERIGCFGVGGFGGYAIGWCTC